MHFSAIGSFHTTISEVRSLKTRRALCQFWSLKIRRTTFLDYIKFVIHGFSGSIIVKGLIGKRACFRREPW